MNSAHTLYSAGKRNESAPPPLGAMWGRGWGLGGASTPAARPGLSRAQGERAGAGETQAWQFSVSFRLGFSEPCSDWGAWWVGRAGGGQAWRERSCLLQALVGGEASSALRSDEKIWAQARGSLPEYSLCGGCHFPHASCMGYKKKYSFLIYLAVPPTPNAAVSLFPPWPLGPESPSGLRVEGKATPLPAILSLHVWPPQARGAVPGDSHLHLCQLRGPGNPQSAELPQPRQPWALGRQPTPDARSVG